MTVVELLEYIGFPVLLASAILVQGWWSGPRPWHAKPPAWPFPAAIGLGFLLAFVLQEGWPDWPPVQKWHWLVPTMIAATVLGVTARLFPRTGSKRLLPELALAFIAGFAMHFPGQEAIEIRLGIGIAVLLATLAGRTAVLRRPAIQLPLLGWMLLATLSIMILQASFAKLAILTGAVSAICAAAAVLTALRRPSSLGIGGHLVIGFAVASIAACGAAYDTNANVPPLAWCLPILALPLAALARVIIPARSPLQSILWGMIVAVICCATALIWTWIAAPIPPDPYL